MSLTVTIEWACRRQTPKNQKRFVDIRPTSRRIRSRHIRADRLTARWIIVIGQVSWPPLPPHRCPAGARQGRDGNAKEHAHQEGRDAHVGVPDAARTRRSRSSNPALVRVDRAATTPAPEAARPAGMSRSRTCDSPSPTRGCRIPGAMRAGPVRHRPEGTTVRVAPDLPIDRCSCSCGRRFSSGTMAAFRGTATHRKAPC